MDDNEKEVRAWTYWFVIGMTVFSLIGISSLTAILLHHEQAAILREFGLAALTGLGGLAPIHRKDERVGVLTG